MATYAYGRVSARDQNLLRQLEAFAEYGVPQKTYTATKRRARTLKERTIAG